MSATECDHAVLEKITEEFVDLLLVPTKWRESHHPALASGEPPTLATARQRNWGEPLRM